MNTNHNHAPIAASQNVTIATTNIRRIKMTEQERTQFLAEHQDLAMKSLERLIEGMKDNDDASSILGVAYYEVGKKLMKFINPHNNDDDFHEKTLLRAISNAMYQVANDVNNSLEEHGAKDA